MNRYKAASIHFAISVAIGVATLAFMLTVWYPGPFFEAVGGAGLVVILLGVDVTLGPLMTLVVFNPAKKSLKFDLAVIGLLQVAAFAYGVSIIFEARPVYVVFVVDRFELVRAVDLDPDDVKMAREDRFKSLPLLRPQLVGTRRPTNPDERLKAIELALKGKDLHLRPEYYVPYEQAQKELVTERLQPMQRLRELNPEATAAIDKHVGALGKKEEEIGFLPLKARNRDLAAVIDRKSGAPLEYWDYKPWTAKKNP